MSIDKIKHELSQMNAKDQFKLWTQLTELLQEQTGLTVNQYHILHDTQEKLKELATAKGLQS